MLRLFLLRLLDTLGVFIAFGVLLFPLFYLLGQVPEPPLPRVRCVDENTTNADSVGDKE
jgi:hypothetical protein